MAFEMKLLEGSAVQRFMYIGGHPPHNTKVLETYKSIFALKFVFRSRKSGWSHRNGRQTRLMTTGGRIRQAINTSRKATDIEESLTDYDIFKILEKRIMGQSECGNNGRKCPCR